MIAAIIQARMGSTRLPGKTLIEILGKPMLWHVVNRVRYCKLINKIIIATTKNERDKPILKLADEMGIDSYRGSEDDVLDRYYEAAKKFGADIIVRITSDCPLIDPEISDKVIQVYLNSKDLDYVSNVIKPTYPDGLDTEVFSFSILQRAWKEARLISEREHVTAHIIKHPEIFKLGNVENDEDLSYMRWTVDEERDYEFVKQVYLALYKPDGIFYMKDILAFLKRNPELMDINRGIVRNEGYLKSLLLDKEGSL